MHNIYNVNRSVAGHAVEQALGELKISKLESSFALPLSSSSVDYYIDDIETTPDKSGLKCIIKGWAFQKDNTAPAKSIYIAYNNKLVSRSTPSCRIDVRIEKDLSFDSCGFQCNFTLPNLPQSHYIVTLVIVAENSSHAHHLKIVNPAELKKRQAMHPVLDKSVVRTNEPSFEYSLDTTYVADGILNLKGWCFLRESPNSEVLVSFLKGGVFLGSTCYQIESRLDVGVSYGLADGYQFYGFEFTSQPLVDLPLDPADASIDMLLIAPAHNKKELVRIYSA